MTILATPISLAPNGRLIRVQGGGRTLMPGLIDAHTHLMFETIADALAKKYKTKTAWRTDILLTGRQPPGKSATWPRRSIGMRHSKSKNGDVG